jgi:CO dehydrogenase/acetyl-CoA synthase alpha subunit
MGSERSSAGKGVDRKGLPVLMTQESTWLRRSLFYDQWNIGLVAFAGASLKC